jgi:hypothetical protein
VLAAVQRAGLAGYVQPDGAAFVTGKHKVYGPDALAYCSEPLPDEA